MSTAVRTLGEVVIHHDFVTVDPTASVKDAVRTMTLHKKDSVLVMRKGRLAGIFTEHDVVTRVVARGLNPSSVPVSEVMTDKVEVARPHESYRAALDRMTALGCRHIPVLDGDRVVGLASRDDLMEVDIQVSEELMARSDPSPLFI